MSHYTTEQRIRLAEYLHKHISNAGQAWYSALQATHVRFTLRGKTETFYPYDTEKPVQQYSINRC